MNVSVIFALQFYALLGQADEAPADPMVQYIIFGVMGLFVLVLLVKGLSSKPDFDATRDISRPDEEQTARSASDIEAEARRVFEIPHVAVDDEGDVSRTKIRIMRTEEEQAPTADDTALESPGDDSPEPEAEIDPNLEKSGKTLGQGLARTKAGFVSRLSQLFKKNKAIDDDLIGDLEEALFTADIGVRTSQRLVDMVNEKLSAGQLKDSQQVWSQIKDEIRNILSFESKPLDLDAHTPYVIMVVGVNGAGKTTTIGKLASLYRRSGKKVLLAAGDTFRAAAVEQLEVWGQRADVPVVRGRENQDPSSVIFDACQRAEAEGFDVIIADTAGRLQAKKELMEELAKVQRVIDKALPGAPHSAWLVLDATVGQNAISQAKEFSQTVDLTGVVLTKLDGTAKGGVVIGICDEMKFPVRYIGIGEQIEDLRVFDPKAFADALFSDSV
ncbi:MAG: signal recognition particle-docking protein FtsY [Myxococcales bacterium]|nr:signal recognition particle-docking protein FtsY [Myxococcales bacterium]